MPKYKEMSIVANTDQYIASVNGIESNPVGDGGSAPELQQSPIENMLKSTVNAHDVD